MWSQIYESVRFGSAYSLVETSDGGYAIAGESGLDSDFCLLKTDEVGNIQWNQTYGARKDEYALSVVETSDGGYTVVGYVSFIMTSGSPFIWAVKTDEYCYIPEFPSWAIIPLVLTITLFSMVIKRNISKRERNQVEEDRR